MNVFKTLLPDKMSVILKKPNLLIFGVTKVYKYHGLINNVKSSNKLLFGQILDLIPSHIISEVAKEHHSIDILKPMQPRFSNSYVIRAD